MRKKILVIGANGQLGMELQQLAPGNPAFDFVFTTREQLSLDDLKAINRFFSEHKPQYCINCAAFTAVDKAESEKESAYRVNAEAPGVMAAACKKNNIQFIHVSTDYVFNGNGTAPYKEDDQTDPVNLYGASKLEGEKLVMRNDPGSIIIRTAWVYSEFGKNFVKTMLRLMAEREQVGVVSDQYGTPTYAADLAEAIMKIISTFENPTSHSPLSTHNGIYHFSNEGQISWYDFAVAIKDLIGSSCKVNPITTMQYPTPAKRPAYSVLDKTRIRDSFNIPIKDWKASLAVCLQKIKNAPK
jgi:dTDP-4-dehydrorhamnose reductase